MRDEHYGKKVVANIGGVDWDLIIVEYPMEDKPKTARCIDRTGTRYTVHKARLTGDGTKVSPEGITRIVASSYCRNNPNIQPLFFSRLHMEDTAFTEA